MDFSSWRLSCSLFLGMPKEMLQKHSISTAGLSRNLKANYGLEVGLLSAVQVNTTLSKLHEEICQGCRVCRSSEGDIWSIIYLIFLRIRMLFSRTKA